MTETTYRPVATCVDYWRLKADPAVRYASGHCTDMYKRAQLEFDVAEDDVCRCAEYCPEARYVSSVFEELNCQMRELFDESGFSNTLAWETPNALWPLKYRWIAVYAVTGGSEGHYIHIDVIADDKRTMIGLCKTFQGWDHACQIAAIAGKILGA